MDVLRTGLVHTLSEDGRDESAESRASRWGARCRVSVGLLPVKALGPSFSRSSKFKPLFWMGDSVPLLILASLPEVVLPSNMFACPRSPLVPRDAIEPAAIA